MISISLLGSGLSIASVCAHADALNAAETASANGARVNDIVKIEDWLLDFLLDIGPQIHV